MNNFKRILSKASLSSSTSGKSITPEDPNITLREIENLKQTVETLKNAIEKRDESIGILAREKEKLYVEFKSIQRTNRNLHQQLEDERDIYAKEKEFLINEIKRLTPPRHENINQNRVLDDYENNFMLEAEIKAKDEIIFNICQKYLKMKSSKMILQKKFKKLQTQCQKACQNIIILLQDNRNTLENLLSRIIESTNTPLNNKNYLRLLKTNANLHYENTQQKVRLSLCIPYQEDLPVNRKKLKKNYKNTTRRAKSDETMKKYMETAMRNLNCKRQRKYTNYIYMKTWDLLDENRLFRSKSDSYIAAKIFL